MNYIETAKSLITRGEIQDASANLLEDILNALLGNPISLGKKYSFTPLAKIVDQYAISYDNVERYPRPEILQELPSPKPQLSVTPELINLDTLLTDDENKE